MEDSQKPLPTFEQVLEEGAERRERELQEDYDPKKDADKLLDELKRDQPIAPDYDEL